MKTRLLINTVSHPSFTAKLSAKNASSFATEKNSEGATRALRIIVAPKNSCLADCRDFPEMWRHSAVAETRSDARMKTNFLFLVHEQNCWEKRQLDRIITVGGVRTVLCDSV